MIELGEAQQLLWNEAQTLDIVEVSLDFAYGRVLAEQVAADRDFPPTDRSAMDGFAVRAEDLGQGVTELEVIGEVRAGQTGPELNIGPGQAARIMTGGVIPIGADAVVMVERTRPSGSGGRVSVEDLPEPGQHIRPRGQEIKSGGPVLAPGVPIHAPEIAALASVGATEVPVYRRPVVHVLATGDEIVEPDERPQPHQLRNSNSRALLAQLLELHIEGAYCGVAPDERRQLKMRLDQGLAGDCLLISGGVSVGEYDLVGEMLAESGMRLLFHKVSVKPGKPILAGRCGDCLVIGLPGNPVSTYVGFAVFVAPALRRMMGYRNWRNLEFDATLDRPLRSKPGRATYHLARLLTTPEGFRVHRVSTTGSGDVLSLARANALIVTPARGVDLAAGAGVRVLAWRDFHLR
jgi:molybdopterin molybdotransferase